MRPCSLITVILGIIGAVFGIVICRTILPPLAGSQPDLQVLSFKGKL